MSRLGRGRPALGYIRGLRPFEARTGTVALSGGGAVTLSAATRTNWLPNPSFEVGASGWSTSAFSVTAGASLARDTANTPYPVGSAGGLVTTTGTNQGACAAAPDLGTFTSGTTYYATVSVKTAFNGDVFEVVLGSTADDFASTLVTGTGAYQTVALAWTPSADRSASNHGLAVRTKQAGSTAFAVDAAAVSNLTEYVDGSQSGAFWLGTANASPSRRGGGKNIARAVTTTGGGAVTLTTPLSSASDVTTSTAGGTITTAGVKKALAAVAIHAGGTVAATGAATQNAGFLGGFLMGGGGRVGRSHPATGIAQPGKVATALAGTTARTGTTSTSAGGTLTTTAGKGAGSTTTATAGGSLVTTAALARIGRVTGTAGGTVTTFGAATPQPGGILGGMMLMGGGGRVGRSHPASGMIAHGNPRLTTASADNRSGSVSGTGGGSLATGAAKGGISTFPVSIPAPPPLFITTILTAGTTSTAGGTITVTYTRTGALTGSVAMSGGGSITTTASKRTSGACTGTGGGTLTLTVRKGARGTTAATGGGTIAITYVRFESHSSSLGMSGGGTLTLTARKNAATATASTGGGTQRATAAKKTQGSTTATSGGTITLTAFQLGPQPTGTTVAHGGGTVTVTGRKNSGPAVTTSTAGGTTTARGAKRGIGAVTVTGGGRVFTTRIVIPVPVYRGLVSPEEIIGVPVLLRR